MLRVNDEVAKKMKNDLLHFKGWLPFQFDAYISLTKRKNFLQGAGLWKQVHEKDLEVMANIRAYGDGAMDYMDKLLKQWVLDNPKFKDIIVFE